jgi:hypothetical protein
MDRSFGAGAKDLLRLALSLILRKRPERMLFAPDAIESNGSYYLYFCLSDGSEGVARSDRPEGPSATRCGSRQRESIRPSSSMTTALPTTTGARSTPTAPG